MDAHGPTHPNTASKRHLYSTILKLRYETYTQFGGAYATTALGSMIEAETTADAEMLRCKRCGFAPSERAMSARSVWLFDVRVFPGASSDCCSHNMAARVSFTGARASSSVLGAEARTRGERRAAVRTGFARRFFVGFFSKCTMSRGTCPVRDVGQNPRRSLGVSGRPKGVRPLANEVAQNAQDCQSLLSVDGRNG